MRRVTSFCSWPHTKTSRIRRTFNSVSCTIVVSSNHASLLNTRRWIDSLSWHRTENTTAIRSFVNWYYRLGRNWPLMLFSYVHITIHASNTAVTHYAAQIALISKFAIERRYLSFAKQ